MWVLVVLIRHMGVLMPLRLVHMAMTVRALRHGLVLMCVVPVVMLVRVLVVERLMLVGVRVALHQVQHNASQHQRRARQQPDAA